MQTIGSRIRELRKRFKMSQKDLAKKVGVSYVSISQWERDENNPKGENLINLVVALKSSPDHILYGKKPKEPLNYTQIDDWDDNTPLNDDDIDIPLISEAPVAAGNGFEPSANYSGNKLRFSKSTLRKQGVDKANAVCVPVAGNSMEPSLKDGSTVGIDLSNTNIKNGDMYVINHAGELRVKILYKQPKNGLRVRSFNIDEYPDEHYTEEEIGLEEIQVIGRVFWSSTLY